MGELYNEIQKIEVLYFTFCNFWFWYKATPVSKQNHFRIFFFDEIMIYMEFPIPLAANIYLKKDG